MKRPNGFSLISVSLSLGIILSFGLALMTYALYTNRASKFYGGTLSAVQIAEAGVTKAIYCLNATSGEKCGATYGSSYTGETDVNFGDGKFTSTITGGGSTRTLSVTGVSAIGLSRTVTVDVTTIPSDDDMDWSYALQSGDGGVYMENNSEVIGSIYSNGDIECQSTTAEINGDAYVTDTGGRIYKCDISYHAHADQIISSDIGGDAYYDLDPSGINGSDIDGNTYPGSATPPPKDLPAIDLDYWHLTAELGGTINGSYYPTDGSTLGPKRINGDLILGQNVDVTVTGPIWIQGDLYTENNSSLILDSSFGPFGTVILADHQSDQSNHGKIHMIPNSGVFGSGDPKSHILLASTNTSVDSENPAIDVSNNTLGAVFLATNGVLKLNNNASAKSMAAYRLHMDNNAVVNYLESEMSDMNFSNSPAGVWRIYEGSWRESD